MASVNKVILVGNLGRDPEMRYMPSGDALASFSIATTDTWKDKTARNRSAPSGTASPCLASKPKSPAST